MRLNIRSRLMVYLVVQTLTLFLPVIFLMVANLFGMPLWEKLLFSFALLLPSQLIVWKMMPYVRFYSQLYRFCRDMPTKGRYMIWDEMGSYLPSSMWSWTGLRFTDYLVYNTKTGKVRWDPVSDPRRKPFMYELDIKAKQEVDDNTEN